jgi:hypothetical protein
VGVTLFMDGHVRREVTDALRLRKVDVLTAQEDGSSRLTDPEVLDRSTSLGRVLFSQDEDLLREAARRQNEGIAFSGPVYGHQLRACDEITYPPVRVDRRDFEGQIV